MKASFHLYPGRSIDSIKDISLFLDDNKWHGIYLSDHFMPHALHVENGKMIECWTGLSYIASITSSIKISSLVSPLSFRHPGILVNMAATVDEISKGRLILGIGAGWQENEHLAYGFNLLEPKERIDRFEEGIQSIIGLLKNNNYSYNGKYFNFKDAFCEPKKYNKDIPILIGCWSGNQRMTDLGHRYGDIVNFIGGPVELHSKLHDRYKNSEKFKNVLYNIILYDDYTSKIIDHDINNPKNKFKPFTFKRYDFVNLESFKRYIQIYKKMNFSEIIIGDMSFLSDEKLFNLINYMRNIIENE